MNAWLVESREISPLVRHFRFETDESLSFVPGQFLSFTVDLGGKVITRAYSIASPPDGNHFDLCLNRVENGLLSPFLFEMAPGSSLEVKGPYGTFTFRHPVNDTLMVATGTGIAPFRSMLHERLPVDRHHQFTLIFGVRHEHGILYSDEFEALERQNPNFHFMPTLTRPSTGWKGLTGRVQGHVIDSLGDRRDVDVYICGMAEMVNDVRAQLKEKGLDRKRIIVEKYD